MPNDFSLSNYEEVPSANEAGAAAYKLSNYQAVDETPNPEDLPAQMAAGNPNVKLESDAAQPRGMLGNLAYNANELLPLAGMMAGGITGGTAGSVVPGAGTVAGGFAGSAAGGALGAGVRDLIKSVVWPEEAPQTMLQGAKNIVSGGVEGTINEAGGLVLGGATKALGSAVGKLAESEAGQAVFSGAKGAIGRTAAGAAIGGYLGGKKGAIVGGTVGALGGVETLNTLKTLLSSDAAMSTPRVSAKTAQIYSKEVQKAGQAVENMMGTIDDSLSSVVQEGKAFPGPTVDSPYLTAGELQAKMIRDAQAYGQANKLPKEYFNAIKRINNQFSSYDPAEIMTAEKTHKLIRNMDAQAGDFGRRQLSNIKNALNQGIITARNLIDEYAAQTGDDSLIQNYANIKQRFSVLKQGEPAVKSVMKSVNKAAKFEAGQEEIARILAAGKTKLTAKYYNILSKATMYGMQNAINRHAYLLMNDPEYRTVIDGLNESNASDIGNEADLQGALNQGQQ